MGRGPLFAYRCAVHLVLPLLAPFLWLADRRSGKRRPPLRHRLALGLPALPQGGIVVHAVSVGEVMVARLLLRELRHRLPNIPMLLTATTATGLRLASGALVADATVPFPLDLPGPVRRFLAATKPRLLVLVETELWPEILAACSARGIPVVLVNARISDRSFGRYRHLRKWLATLLEPITLGLAQSPQDAERLVAIGIPAGKVRVTGNIKFDAVPPGEINRDLRAALMTLARGRAIVVAGSTMPGEEKEVLKAIAPLRHQVFCLMAPRHPERAQEALELCQDAGLSCLRRSLLSSTKAPADVLVVDTVGELAALYQLGQVAFVGGSLVPTGGHNPIEPALFGVPVLTGPHVHNFASVYQELINKGGAFIVHNGQELGQSLRFFLQHPDRAQAAGEAAKAVLVANTGATVRTVQALETLLA
ncbi:MAG: 3-deoxy-D-manno-octulosonic acid transferase [Thermoanaerobaculaceae bacterium]